jgi:hypothetical protein
VSRRAIALVVVTSTTAILSATALAAASAWPKPGHYTGTTSEHGNVTFKVADHGKRVSDFTTVDGYNNMCHYTGAPPHIFHYIVAVPLMKINSSGSFTGTAKATVGFFTGTFRVKGKFSSGQAHGTVTRVGRPAGTTCGSGASNPTTSDYLETFTAKRT